MKLRRATALLATPVLLATVLVGPSDARGSQVVPRIPEAPVVDAPIGKPGGIMTPSVYCTDYEVEPEVTSTITSLETGVSRTYSWTDAYPGYGFPRVKVGAYTVRTTATCDGFSRTRTETVRVKEKTHQRTVSPAEWRKIKRGMTVKRVAGIIGYNGTFTGRYQGKASRLYDMMPFWAWSYIEYRNGKVVGKYWNVGHD